MRFSKLVISLSFLAVFFCGGYAASQGFLLRSHSSSMEPVDIRLSGKVHLRIPKAYLVKVENWRGGEQESIYMEAVLPDMRPIKPEENRTIDEKLVVLISLKSATNEQYFKNRLRAFSKIQSYFVPTGFGLGKLSESYHEDRRQGKAPGAALFPSDDYYLVLKEKSFVQIKCEKSEVAKCRATTIFPSNIAGHYSFDRAFIPEKWQEIDNKVNEFIQDFIVSEEKDSKK